MSASSEDVVSRDDRIRRDLLPIVLCIAAGVLISVLPHLIWWAKQLRSKDLSSPWRWPQAAIPHR